MTRKKILCVVMDVNYTQNGGYFVMFTQLYYTHNVLCVMLCYT